MSWSRCSVLTALLLVSLGVSTSVLIGCSRNDSLTEQQYIQRAKDFEDKGDLRSGILELKNALQKNPKSAEARWWLGQVYVKAGMGSAAETELKKAAELGVSPGSVQVPLAEALLLQGAYQRLVDEVHLTAAKSKVDSAKLLRFKGEGELGIGKLERGCAMFEEAAQADPKYASALLGLAKCAFAKGDKEGARAHIARAQPLAPNDIDAWLLEGELENQLGNAKAGFAAYGHALIINPNNLGALTGHAFTAIQLKDTATAEKDLAKAKQLIPNNLLIKYLEGLLAFRRGELTRARDIAQDVLGAAPDYTPALLLKGLAYYGLKGYGPAQVSLSKVLGRQPDNLQVRKLLGSLMIQTGQAQQAVPVLEPALKQGDIDPESMVLAAGAFATTGDLAKARQLFSQALEKHPGDAALHVNLAQTYLASGDTAAATKELKLATDADTPDYRANKLLVTTLVQQRRYDEAVAAAHSLQAKLPGKALPFNLEGTVYLARGDLANARRSFTQAISADPADQSGKLNFAQVDMAENKLQEARSRLEGLTSGESKTAPALMILARIDLREGKEPAYLKSLQDALRIAPDMLSARLQLMSYYLRKNDPQTALSYGKEGDERAASNPDFLALMGKAQMAAGEPAGAVTTYGRLLQISPNSPSAHLGMASAQAASGNAAAVRRELHATLKLDPNNAEALASLAMLEAESGNAAGALSYAAKLQEHDPKSPVGFALEGDILLGQHKPGEAAKQYDKAFALAPSSDTLLSLAKAYYRAGQKPMAYEKVGQWLMAHPDDLRVRAHLAEAEKADGRYREAAEQYEYVLAKRPDDLVAQNNLALIYLPLKDPRALELAEKAYARQSKAAAIADTYGWVLLKLGQPDKALTVLRNAASSAPQARTIRYHLAQALLATGRRDEARRELEDLMKGGKPFPESEQAKALLAELRGH